LVFLYTYIVTLFFYLQHYMGWVDISIWLLPYPWGKDPIYSWKKNVGEPYSWSAHSGKKENISILILWSSYQQHGHYRHWATKLILQYYNLGFTGNTVTMKKKS
jgi:hypothetical protein